VTPGLGGIVVAAPHEGFDIRTAEVASAAATVLGAGYVAATGFRTREHPINVNRPTEGAHLKPDEESRTERALTVFQAYHARLGEAARGPVRLLVEVHGNSRPENVGLIEIATVGVSTPSAEVLKVDLRSRFPAMRIAVEPVDRVHYAATASKESGAMSRVPQAVHVELPKDLREPSKARETGTKLGQTLKAWLTGPPASVSAPVSASVSVSVPPYPYR
jgi:hypothetical protein